MADFPYTTVPGKIFGARQLAEVTLASVQEFIKALLGKGLSAKTIGNVIVILKEMFKHAVQWGYLDSNPVQYVERPRGEDKEMDVLTPVEIRRLLDAQEEPLRTLLLTAVLTGMRQGELFGLQWEDIDFARHQVHVRRSLWHGTLGTPKSRRSRRAIDMPPTLEQALKQSSTTRKSEFVFCSERGRRSMPITSGTGSSRQRSGGPSSAASAFTTSATRIPAC